MKTITKICKLKGCKIECSSLRDFCSPEHKHIDSHRYVGESLQEWEIKHKEFLNKRFARGKKLKIDYKPCLVYKVEYN